MPGGACAKKLVVVLALGSGLGSGVASAQTTRPAPEVEYLDSTFVRLPSAVGARYRRETERTDSVGGVVRTYFLNGRLRSVSPKENMAKGIPHGTFESWHENGQLAHHAEYTHGQPTGEMRMYYATGQLKRREKFSPDAKSTGECFAEDGTPIPFFAFEIMPVYPEGDGGFRALVNAIQRKVKYPKEARKAGVAGRVVASFLVNSRGEVVDIKVVHSVFPSLDAAVLDAIRQLKPFKPGQQDGKPVSVSFTVPISFAVQ